MAAVIRLEDGRGLYGTSLSIDAMLTMIAEHVGDGFGPLRVWLADKARRPAPFQDLDVGGLGPSARSEFYAAAGRARSAKLRDDPTLAERSHGIQQLARLLAMRASIDRGESPLQLSDFDCVLPAQGPEDLTELWGD